MVFGKRFLSPNMVVREVLERKRKAVGALFGGKT